MGENILFDRFSRKSLIGFAIITILYWSWFAFLIGPTPSEYYFYILLLCFFFFNKSSRQIFVIFSPFFIYLTLYSSLRALQKINVFPIHIEDLYNLELKLFGIYSGGEKISVNEYFLDNLNIFSDLFSGSFYITWVPFPIIFGFIVFFSKKSKIGFDFWLCFLIANLIGFIGYIVYPAAPPWYYFEYGNELISSVPGNAAGLARFDEITGLTLYQTMYSQGTNTFGAMPSMHAAFPLILVYYSLKFKNYFLTALFFISLIGIWYGAVYTSHHYIIDIVIGIVCGIIGLFITEYLVNRKFVPIWYKNAISYIEKN